MPGRFSVLAQRARWIYPRAAIISHFTGDLFLLQQILSLTPGGWIGKVVGLLLTGFAISQGSQLWFDLMKRVLNGRAS